MQPIADSTVAQGRSVHFESLHRIGSDRSKMALNEVWSSAIGLTESTVTGVVAQLVPLAGGFLMLATLEQIPWTGVRQGKLTLGHKRPVISRRESTGCVERANLFGGRMAGVPVKYGFFRKASH